MTQEEHQSNPESEANGDFHRLMLAHDIGQKFNCRDREHDPDGEVKNRTVQRGARDADAATVPARAIAPAGMSEYIAT